MVGLDLCRLQKDFNGFSSFGIHCNESNLYTASFVLDESSCKPFPFIKVCFRAFKKESLDVLLREKKCLVQSHSWG